MIRARLGTAAMFLAVAWLASACDEGLHPEGTLRAPGADTVLSDSAALALAALNAQLEPGELNIVQGATVERWIGPGERPFEVAVRTEEQEAGHPRRYGSVTYPTALRARSVSQYPCTSCHFGRTVVMADERIGDAHQNIQPVHPEQTGAVCSTCHSEENVELLALKRGERATLTQSYRLCAQCHFQQVGTWAGGGHGKRLDGWQGRRVLMGCGDCHDPHRPALVPRIPFPAPRLERPKGDGP